MRGKTLTELIAALRAEIGHSVNPALGANTDAYLTQVIQRTQDKLWEEYDWSHLRVSRDIPVVAYQRYYPAPTDLPYERLISVHFKWGDRWDLLTHGIDERDYSIWDSDRGIASWPALKWDVAEDTADTAGTIDDQGMIEIWPLPPRDAGANGDGNLRLTGFRKIKPLTAPSDKCEIDGTLIVLYAASEIVARQNQSDAQMKAQLAGQLLSRLMNQSSNKKKFTSFTEEFEDNTGGFRPREVTSVSNLGNDTGGGGGGYPGDGVFLPLAGGTMVGDIVFATDVGWRMGQMRVNDGVDTPFDTVNFDAFTYATRATSIVFSALGSLGGRYDLAFEGGVLRFGLKSVWAIPGWSVGAEANLANNLILDGWAQSSAPTRIKFLTRSAAGQQHSLLFDGGTLGLTGPAALITSTDYLGTGKVTAPTLRGSTRVDTPALKLHLSSEDPNTLAASKFATLSLQTDGTNRYVDLALPTEPVDAAWMQIFIDANTGSWVFDAVGTLNRPANAPPASAPRHVITKSDLDAAIALITPRLNPVGIKVNASGQVAANGTLGGNVGILSVSHTAGTGIYTVNLSASLPSVAKTVVQATVTRSDATSYACTAKVLTQTSVQVNTFLASGGAGAADQDFMVTVIEAG